MFSLNGAVKYKYIPNYQDMRGGYDKLCGVVRSLGEDPDDGTAYVFTSKNQKIVKIIRHETGCNWNYFTHYEGNSGDGVSVLKKGRLRLYCIYFNDTVVCFGTGGYKPENIRAYQEDKELDAKVNIIKSVAKQINKDISKGNLRVRQNGELDYIN